jgi:hypothetical protein
MLSNSNKNTSLLGLLYKSDLERPITTYTVGSSEIDNVLIDKKYLNPSGRDTVPTKPAYSSKNPYNVGLNIIDDRVVNINP